MTITFNGTEFTEITATIDGERMSGLMIHDLNDENKDGDAICTNAVSLPENEEDASDLLENETWVSDFEIMAAVEAHE